MHAGPTLTEVVKYEDGCFSNMHIVHVVTECFTAGSTSSELSDNVDDVYTVQ